MEQIKIEQNTINIGDKQVIFPLPISSIYMYGNLYLILLEVPEKYTFHRNVYAITLEGALLWQIQDISDIYPLFLPLPIVELKINEAEGQIIAIDFYGVKFEIDPDNGKIINMVTARW